MAKEAKEKAPEPEVENSKEVFLERLDAVGGLVSFPNKAAAERLLKLEASMGVTNYAYPKNGDTE